MSDKKENKTESTTSDTETSTSGRKSRGTLVSMTGDETDEECEQIAAEMLEALGFKTPKKKKQ